MTVVYGLKFSVGVDSLGPGRRICYHRTMARCGHLGPIVLRNSLCHLISPCKDGRASDVCIGGSGGRTVMFTFSICPHCNRRVLPMHLRKLRTGGVCRIGRVGLVPKTSSSMGKGKRAFSNRCLVGMNLSLFANCGLGDHVVRVVTRWGQGRRRVRESSVSSLCRGAVGQVLLDDVFAFVLVANAVGTNRRARCMGPFVKAKTIRNDLSNGGCPNTAIPFKVVRLDPSAHRTPS